MSWDTIEVANKMGNRTPRAGAYLRRVSTGPGRSPKYHLDLGPEVAEFLGLSTDGRLMLMVGRGEDAGKLAIRPGPEGARYTLGVRGGLSMRLPTVFVQALRLPDDAEPLIIEDVTTSRLALAEDMVRIVVIDVRAITGVPAAVAQ